MMPLTMAKAGETVTIKKITGKDESGCIWQSWVLWWTVR